MQHFPQLFHLHSILPIPYVISLPLPSYRGCWHGICRDYYIIRRIFALINIMFVLSHIDKFYALLRFISEGPFLSAFVISYV